MKETLSKIIKISGPGLLFASTAIGVSHLIQSTRAGADFGLMIIGFVVTLATMWFTLKADIAYAATQPEPVIERVEYDLKDELIRQTIMDTQEDVEMLLEKFDKLEERMYEMSKNK